MLSKTNIGKFWRKNFLYQYPRACSWWSCKFCGSTTLYFEKPENGETDDVFDDTNDAFCKKCGRVGWITVSDEEADIEFLEHACVPKLYGKVQPNVLRDYLIAQVKDGNNELIKEMTTELCQFWNEAPECCWREEEQC